MVFMHTVISLDRPPGQRDVLRTMGSLMYIMNTSLDGYVEGPDGKFDWSEPDEEVHRFHEEMTRGFGCLLYGRRMYETMAVWDAVGTDPAYASWPAYTHEYARTWRGIPKVVFSSTLTEVGPNCRLVRSDAAAEVARLKQQPGGPMAVSGPTLAASLARAGLIDEYRQVIFPVLVGSGKPYLAPVGRPIPLRLVETKTFRRGVIYLSFQLKTTTIDMKK
jgi:dihydrofolate reductase